MIKILELFGGIGSPRVALRNLGVPTKAIDYVEIDEQAVRSYNAMFEGDLAYKPQTVVDYNLKPDILIHGSPCQDISVIGKKRGAEKGSGTRSSLMWETVHIIEQMGEWKPKYVIWENVKGVLTKRMNKNFKQYLDYMESLGYTNAFEVLDARGFGIPQARERVFTVSRLGDVAFDFSKLQKSKMRPIDEFLDSSVGDEYVVTQPSMLNKINTSGDSSFNGYLPIIEDFCWTITTKQMRCPNSGVVPLGDGRFRYLTPKETWLLQGYSEGDYHKAASVNKKTALYKQAGNSIPVPIFEALFQEILKDVSEEDAKQNVQMTLI